MEPGTLTEQIASSIEDVRALLQNNRSLSVALLSRRLTDLEKEVRTRFRVLESMLESRFSAMNATVHTLEDRLNVAGKKFSEMREDVDNLKEG